jgi:hypothetical protein
MFMMCSAVSVACSAASAAADDDAGACGSPDPARAVKPAGTPGCKNACTGVHGGRRKARNSPVDRTAAPKNPPAPSHCAGPRAAGPRQLTLHAAHDSAADSADSAHAGVPGPPGWPGSAGWPATAASVWPPPARVAAIVRTCPPRPIPPFAALEQTTPGPIPTTLWPLAGSPQKMILVHGRVIYSRCTSLGAKLVTSLRGVCSPAALRRLLLYQTRQSRDSPTAPWARPTARFWATSTPLLTGWPKSISILAD